MSIKNAKFIIAEIEKLAKFSDPGGGAPISPSTTTSGGKFSTTPTTYKPSASGISGVKSANVMKMQKAMQDLAATVMSDSGAKVWQNAPVKDKEKASSTTKVSRKGFADFIAQNYTSELDDQHKGVTWGTDESLKTYPEKKPMEAGIYEMDAVMDTMKRIGGAKSELKIDGNWDFRTDNALKNMLAFAYALLQLEGDFGMPPNNIYNKVYWDNFSKLLTGYTVDPDTKSPVGLSFKERDKRAIELTTHILAIHRLYSHVKHYILNHPVYKTYIEGINKFDPSAKEMGLSISPGELELHKKSKSSFVNIYLPAWKGKVKQPAQQIQVFLNWISDLDMFKKFITNVLKCPPNQLEAQVPEIYNEIKKQIFSLKSPSTPSEGVKI